MYRLTSCGFCNKTYCSERKLKKFCHPAHRRIILFCSWGFGFVIGDGRKSYLVNPHINHRGHLPVFTSGQIISIIDYVYRNDHGNGCETVLGHYLQGAAATSSVLSRAADVALVQLLEAINAQLPSTGEFHYIIRSPNVVGDAIPSRSLNADGVAGVQHMIDVDNERSNFTQFHLH